ncbi:ADP-dependent (S)-NAD(P)H-hydrate dehydratase [Actinomycetota bacterium]|nr:ADP-dependent (S)-NAD(P)H-hydrate dehydratase [Actinomycetota bacterium]
MPTPETVLSPALLRAWPLPERSGSKDERGRVLVVGGARRTPGAVLLTGLAALRVGAGRLTLAAAGSVAVPLAVAVPEAGVIGLPERSDGSLTGEGAGLLAAELDRADVVVVGPGLDEPTGTTTLLTEVLPRVGTRTAVLLDAFALGVLADLADLAAPLADRLVLTPNLAEAGRLLGRAEVDPDVAAVQVAHRYGAVAVCAGKVAAPDGRRWASATGSSGLGTSGSGDVLAGAIAGVLAGGADPAHAACWGLSLHGTAGDRLAARIGPLGYLARELVDELPAVLVELRA